MASEPVKTYKVCNPCDPTNDTLTITSDTIWQSAVLQGMFSIVDNEFLSEDFVIPLDIADISPANLRLVFSWLDRHKTDATDSDASNKPCNSLIDQDEIPSDDEAILSQTFACRKPTAKTPEPAQSRPGGHTFKQNPSQMMGLQNTSSPDRDSKSKLHVPMAKDIPIPDIKVVFRKGDAAILCAADPNVLFQVGNVANYLEMESLLELVLHAIALRVLPLSIEEMRGFFWCGQ